MANLAFPSNPNNGQVYSASGKSWEWDGTAWVLQRFESDPGLSAYQVALAHGFVGSEEVWLESIRGAPGADGNSLPLAGTTGQILAKTSNLDKAVAWINPPAGITTLDGLTDVDTTTGAPNNGQALIWDATGAKWIPGDVAPAEGDPHYYKITGFFAASPLANEVLQIQVVDEAFTFAAGFAGSAVKLNGVAPASSCVLSVRKNVSIEIGTITIGADGSSSMATTGNIQQSAAIGDAISLHGPALTDTATNFSWTLRGTKQ